MCLSLLALQEALQLFNIFASALSIAALSSAAAAAILWVVFAADDNFEHLAKTATIKYA